LPQWIRSAVAALLVKVAVLHAEAAIEIMKKNMMKVMMRAMMKMKNKV
jgi:hypothetical protein